MLLILCFYLGDSLINLDGFLWHVEPDAEIHETVEQEVLDLVILVAGHRIVDVGEHLVEMLLDDEHLLLILHTDQLALRQRLEASKQLAKSKIVWINSFGVQHLLENCKGFVQVLDLVHERLRGLLTLQMLLLLHGYRLLFLADLNTEAVDINTDHEVEGGYVSDRVIQTNVLALVNTILVFPGFHRLL